MGASPQTPMIYILYPKPIKPKDLMTLKIFLIDPNNPKMNSKSNFSSQLFIFFHCEDFTNTLSHFFCM